MTAFSSSSPPTPTATPTPSSTPPHVLLVLRGNVTTQPAPGTSWTTSASALDAHASHGRPAWVPAVIATAIVLAIAVVGALVTWTCTRRRRQRLQFQRARRLDPQLTAAQFRRRQRMSKVDLAAENERARLDLIRKSLISRSSTSLSYLGPGARPESLPLPSPSLSHASAAVDGHGHGHSHSHSHSYGHGHGPVPIAGVRDDWKAWEVRMHRQPSRAAVRHPSQDSSAAQHDAHVSHDARTYAGAPPVPPRSLLRPQSTDDLSGARRSQHPPGTASRHSQSAQPQHR